MTARFGGPFLGKKMAESSDLNFVCDSLTCEIINMKLCKYILVVNKHATNDAVRGERGRFPLLFQVMQRSLNFYSITISSGENHLMKHACNSIGSWFSLLDQILGKYQVTTRGNCYRIKIKLHYDAYWYQYEWCTVRDETLYWLKSKLALWVMFWY